MAGAEECQFWENRLTERVHLFFLIILSIDIFVELETVSPLGVGAKIIFWAHISGCPDGLKGGRAVDARARGRKEGRVRGGR